MFYFDLVIYQTFMILGTKMAINLNCICNLNSASLSFIFDDVLIPKTKMKNHRNEMTKSTKSLNSNTNKTKRNRTINFALNGL